MASIDWVNLDLQGVPISPLVDAGFIFKGEHDIHSGEVWDFPIIGNLDCLEYKAKSEQFVRLSGSVHKLWNIWSGDGEHNANQFPFSDQVFMIDWLAEIIGRKAKDIPVVGLEFGVNVHIPFDSKEVVSKWIKALKWKQPNKRIDYRRKGYLIEFDLSKTFLKVYAKSYQFGLPFNVLRIEIKTKSKAEYIRKKGIWTLADLTNPQIMLNLHQDIVERTESLIVIPPHPEQILFDENIKFFKDIQNPAYWTDLHPILRDYPKRSKDKAYNRDRKRAYKTLEDTKKRLSIIGADRPHKRILEEVKGQKDALCIVSNC